MSFSNLINQAAQKFDIVMADDVIPMMIYMFSQIKEPPRELVIAKTFQKFKTNEEKVKYLVEDIIERAGFGSNDAGFSFIDAYSVWSAVMIDDELSQILRTDYIPFPPRFVSKLVKSHPEKVEYPAYAGLLRGYADRFLTESKTISEQEKVEKRLYASYLYEFLHVHFMKSDIVHLNLNNVYNELVRVTNRQ